MIALLRVTVAGIACTERARARSNDRAYVLYTCRIARLIVARYSVTFFSAREQTSLRVNARSRGIKQVRAFRRQARKSVRRISPSLLDFRDFHGIP